jgi:hypothetical protein
MRRFNLFTRTSLYALALAGLTFTSCKKDDDDAVPAEENELEVITDIKLIFTNNTDPKDIVEARAKDPDGAGIEDLKILDEITLDTSKNYTLTFEIMNNLDSPGEDIGEEITEEDDEHQLFFGFSNNAFGDPNGNGNIDNASDDVHYNDKDGNGNALGLSTSWKTSSAQLSEGKFRVILKHQPDVKSSSSSSNDGETDFDLEFVLNIK